MTLSEEDKKLADGIMEGDTMNQGREFRYQVDWSFQGQMYHVRCDDWEEFKIAKLNMESILPKQQAFPDDIGSPTATPASAVVPNNPVCGIHGTSMKLRQGKFGQFYSCGQKNADGSWCQWKPLKQ